jgi:hypothetical protein
LRLPLASKDDMMGTALTHRRHAPRRRTGGITAGGLTKYIDLSGHGALIVAYSGKHQRRDVERGGICRPPAGRGATPIAADAQARRVEIRPLGSSDWQVVRQPEKVQVLQ